MRFDDAARAALRGVQAELSPLREEIMVHSQFRRNTATSPLDPNWGKPNPIDINGMIEKVFAEGMRYAIEAAKKGA